MHFGFALDELDVDLWDIDLLGTDLDLLDTDIPREHFVCLQDVFKAPSKHVFKTYLQDVFSITIFSLPGCLEDVLRDVFDRRQGIFASHLQLNSWKAKDCYTEDVLKTYSIHVLSPLQDVLKTKTCLLGLWQNDNHSSIHCENHIDFFSYTTSWIAYSAHLYWPL